MDKLDAVIVGGGPAGIVLGLLLARKELRVCVVEAQDDFDRDFRGDTVHPSTLQMLDGIGLADRVLEIDHVKLTRMNLVTSDGAVAVADFGESALAFPYIAVMPQHELLDVLAQEAQRYPGFAIRMGTRVRGLAVEDRRVVGVYYEDTDGHGELRSSLVVGADGRGSAVRRASGLHALSTSPPMDVLWFRLPRNATDVVEDLTSIRIAEGHMLVMFARTDEWQIGYVILKGTAREVRDAGIDTLRDSVASLVPPLADRVGSIDDWSDVHVLSVKSDRLRKWFKAGLLCVGDAAHVMSPVGGVGINYAIQDAVATHNLLHRSLAAGGCDLDALESVQRRRELPTRFIQRVQTILQNQLVRRALSDEPFSLPWPARLPWLQSLLPRLLGVGVRPEFVED